MSQEINSPTKKLPLYQKILSIMLPLFFRLLYHSFAWTYDLVADMVSLGRWKRWVMAAPALLIGDRVLELGFGPGHLQARLHQSGRFAVGLDESRDMTRQANRRLRRSGYASRLARGLAQHIPLASSSFDSVVATFPTLYIVDPLTLVEILRVLRPGGRLVVLSFAWITGKSFRERLMDRLFRVTGEVPPENMDIARLTEPFTKAGFDAKLRFVEQPGSRLLFIIAAKPVAPQPPMVAERR